MLGNLLAVAFTLFIFEKLITSFILPLLSGTKLVVPFGGVGSCEVKSIPSYFCVFT